MTITVVTAATAEPVTLAEARAQLTEIPDGDDPLVTRLIEAARASIEAWANLRLMSQTLDVTFDAFPTYALDLPVGPVQSITSISYYDSDDASQTWASAKYERTGRRIRPVATEAFPATYERFEAVTVRAVVGYATAADVPADIKHALLMLLAHLYLNREAVITGTIATELPLGVQHLIGPHRVEVLA